VVRKRKADPRQHELDIDIDLVPSGPVAEGEFRSRTKLVDYLYAGKAVITIQSRKTAQHFTYRVQRIPNSDVFTVAYRGPSMGWFYLASIFERSRFVMTRKSPQAMRLHPAFEAFKFFHDWLSIGKFHKDLRVWHHGKCGACGRNLTDPLSLKEGIGPECRVKRLRVDV
jgi:hypothetical protein